MNLKIFLYIYWILGPKLGIVQGSGVQALKQGFDLAFHIPFSPW
jgi:predicted branched-subunit amino acid permease